ncbi:MAG: KpsF/GutQ family sugar-phosphate isomerase [Proteobacteria bacterium]|nr:KpsF/GutQ family sugar-phosphate isomerase [Pseudomonadota bacterium]
MTAQPADAPESASAVLEAARRVLRLEAAAIEALSHSLGGEFDRAVHLLYAATGRVVVSGMGKSGHVARKIAATFASTGTPALFVHPAEASHGDLGMIAPGDAVMVLSNSGETAEVADMVNYCRRFSIPLVAITGRAASTLGQTADLVLVLPDVPEACPLGLAPTTSTTATLALGDALAVALLELRGFSSEQFQQLHPGGRLGRRLVRVRDIQHEGDALPLVAATAPMTEALLEISAKSFGCAGVVDAAGRLAGIITDGDLRRNMDDGLLARTAAAVMTPNPKTIAGNALASEALGRMTTAKITSLFVAEDGRPVGIVHLHDCLRAGVDVDVGGGE